MKFFPVFFLVAILLSPALAEPVKVACVGDSITFGAGVKNRAVNCYPAQLQGILGADYIVKNFGVSGATMLKKGDKPYWKLKSFGNAKAFAPDIVVIKLGTNDTKPQNWKHGSEFSADYQAMIEEFGQLESKPKIYVCLPVPVFATRWGINDATVKADVIPAVIGIAKATGSLLIDLNSPFLGKPEVVPDSVHPNAEGARILAETVAAALKVQATKAE